MVMADGMLIYAYLDEKYNVVPCTFDEAGIWFQQQELEGIKWRRVAADDICGYYISTAFLMINHGYGGTPKWFETMVFQQHQDLYCDRYETWDQAEAGHKEAIELCRQGKMEDPQLDAKEW